MEQFDSRGAHGEEHILGKWKNLIPAGHTRMGTYVHCEIWSPGAHEERHTLEKCRKLAPAGHTRTCTYVLAKWRNMMPAEHMRMGTLVHTCACTLVHTCAHTFILVHKCA